jgi:hypothetical protein
MINNRLLHELAMARKARQSQMDTPVPELVPDIKRNIKEETCESFGDSLDSDSGYGSDYLSGASEGEGVEDGINHTDHEDSILTQSAARDKLESFMSFAEDAGLDRPSVRIALGKSMGDEDRYPVAFGTI